MTFSTMLGVTEILCCFKLVLAGKTGKEIPESSRLEFIEKFSANNFALSDAEDANDHEDHPNQQENNHKLCDETGHPVVN